MVERSSTGRADDAPATLARSFFATPRSSIAISLSTKDRPELTKRTLPALSAETGFDLFWFDGSRTAEGRSLALSAESLPNVRELHLDVVGGPDAAIVCALSRMYELGYAYCGVIENDIQLQSGWFGKVMTLFEHGRDAGLEVGAVTARSIDKRVLCRRREFCVLFNAGAGMLVLTREATRIVLDTYRTSTAEEIRDVFLACTGLDPAPVWELPPPDPRRPAYPTSADWWYDAALQLHGMCTLGPVPTMAENVDADLRVLIGSDYVRQPAAPTEADDAAFAALVERQRQRRALADQPDPYATTHTYLFDAQARAWTVFPHQAVAVPGGARTEGTWSMQWTQAFGPFSYRSDQPGSAFSFELCGADCSIVMGAGPDAGKVALELGDRREIVDLFAPEVDRRLINLNFPDRQLRRVWVRLIDDPHPFASGNLVRWFGLQFPEIQPWFRPVRGFSYGAIGPMIPKPT